MQDLMPTVDTPDKLFHDGDPTQGIEGTIVTAEWLNDSQGATRDAQQELKNVLAAADILPDESKQNQLLTAINALISSAVTASKYVPDVGDLYTTTNTSDPAVKFPGTVWEFLGEGLTLRTAKADGSNVGTTTGADSVTLSTANLPSHSHTIGGSTGSSTATAATTSSFDYGTKTSSSTDLGTKNSNSFDYGTKTTSGGGSHNHGYTGVQGNAYPDGSTDNVAAGDPHSFPRQTQVLNAGDHSHTVGIGAHSHSTVMGAHTHTVAVGAHTHTVTVPAHTHTLPANTGAAGSGSAVSVVNKSILVMVWKRTA